MWSSDVSYAKQNGGNTSWIIQGTEAVPTEQAFWDWLLAEAKGWGLYVYEQDWLFTEWVGAPAMLQSATLPREWLAQMDAAAAKNGLVVQYCMLWPRMALQSLEFSSVTTARGSTDYKAGGNDQWIMGLSSLFLDSLALRPTKDNFFTTDKQGDGKKGVEKFNRLQSLVSTLSTGPVFPSDAINSSDVPLIMRSCNADGLLLRPDRAATNVDGNILAKAWANENSNVQQPGELQSTTSTVSGLAYTYLLAAQTAASTVDRVALYPALPASAPSYLAYESNSSSTLHVFDGKTPLQVAANDRWSFNYWTVAPPLSNGYFFLGEASQKWIAVSKQRFTSIAVSSSATAGAGFNVAFVGKPSEKVQLAWAPPITAGGAAPDQKSVTCTVGAGGTGSASFPEGKCI